MPSRFRTALALALAFALLAFSSVDVLARANGLSSAYAPHSSSSGSNRQSALSSSRSVITCMSCPRNSRGKITRDPNAVSKFKRTNPEPPGCHQCDVYHIIPLSKGGKDDASNMQ